MKTMTRIALFLALLGLCGCQPNPPTFQRPEQKQTKQECPDGKCPLKKPAHNPYSDI